MFLFFVFFVIMKLMWKVVEEKNILISFLEWHFLMAPKEILTKVKSVFFFNLNYFSISFLIKTFFAPWKRYKFSYGKGFNIGRFFEVLTFNIFSRFMGMTIRFFVILAGILIQILIVFVGVISVLLWITLPVIMIFFTIISLQWIG